MHRAEGRDLARRGGSGHDAQTFVRNEFGALIHKGDRSEEGLGQGITFSGCSDRPFPKDRLGAVQSAHDIPFRIDVHTVDFDSSFGDNAIVDLPGAVYKDA